MDIAAGNVFFFSDSGREAPRRVRLLKELPTSSGRAAVVVECESIVPGYGTDKLLLVPQQSSDSLSGGSQSMVPVYVFDGRPALEMSILDESVQHAVLDWGGLIEERAVGKWTRRER
jgi:hypothetical protein